MTRKEGPPEDARRDADLAESDRAEGADGLPLPPAEDAETRRARDSGQSDEPGDGEDAAQRDLDGTIAAERGAD
jgi:hypothetical protein